MSRLFRSALSLVVILPPLLITPRVNANQYVENCSEALLRDLGVAIINCSGATCGAQDNIVLPGRDNQEDIFIFFLRKGLTSEQAAGVAGNILWESGGDPENIQDPGGRSPNPEDAGSAGWGLAQWTPGSKIYTARRESGVSGQIKLLSTQLNIIWWELENKAPTGRTDVLSNLKQTETVEEATELFMDQFEAPGKPLLEKRIEYATETLRLYGDTNVNGPVSCATGSFTGDGFVVYSQYDPKWKDLPYSTSTIGGSGCGPSAMAMIVTAFGQTATPPETSRIAADAGAYVPNAGSRVPTLVRSVSNQYGLEYENIPTETGAVVTALQQGKLVITSGSGPKPFTSGGHIIVIRGVTENGNFLIGDSGHNDTSDQEWPAEQIIAGMKTREGTAHAVWR